MQVCWVGVTQGWARVEVHAHNFYGIVQCYL